MNEAQIIEWIRRHAAPPTRDLVLGIGDDCAIYRPRRKEDQVFTTDFLIEDVHFTRDIYAPEAAGHKALARSLSDLAPAALDTVRRAFPDLDLEADDSSDLRHMAKMFGEELPAGLVLAAE